MRVEKGFFVGFCFAKYTFLKPCGLVLVLFVNFKYWGTEVDWEEAELVSNA